MLRLLVPAPSVPNAMTDYPNVDVEVEHNMPHHLMLLQLGLVVKSHGKPTLFDADSVIHCMFEIDFVVNLIEWLEIGRQMVRQLPD
jgi:hypothetical protein